MKKRFLFMLVLFCFLLSGCKSSKLNTSETPAPIETLSPLPEENVDSLLVEYLSAPEQLVSPVREFGENTAYIQMEEDLVVHISYPESNIEVLNTALKQWVDDTVASYQEEAAGSSSYGEAAELTAEYESYLVNENLVSIKLTGFYDRPYLAHPVDLIAVFHVNLETGQLLTLDDLLLAGGRQKLVEMVCEDANITEEIKNKHLLDFWNITSEGLEITLQRGDYLPMSEGTVVLKYSYETLGDILSLEGKPEISTQEPTPESSTVLPSTVPATNVDPEKPMVALTFDDGPSKHTDRLLDLFQTHGGKGTFFVIGNLVDSRPETIHRMATEGHEIGGHSWNHRQLTKLTSQELTDQIMSTRAKIYEISGVDPTLLRPPYGSFNDQTKQVCQDLGIIMANWSLDTLDWKYKDADRIYRTIMNEVSDGDIILCHDLHGTTVDAMERVIPDLIEQGYQLVTVSELLQYSEKEISPGNVYYQQ